LIEALHNMRPIPDGYLRAKEAFEMAVLASQNGSSAEAAAISSEAKEDFSATLDLWQQQRGEREGLMEALDEKRRSYEQRLIDLEFASALDVLATGEHASMVREFAEAHRAFEEAEVRCEEVREPYEQAIQQAQQNYETKRQEYLRMVEDIREQLDKAPDEYRQRFDEILANYTMCVPRRSRKWLAPAGSTFSAPNGMKADASITSCAAGPDGREIPAPRASIFPLKTI
jgi:tetratricopeptide (TPR) repeat protein